MFSDVKKKIFTWYFKFLKPFQAGSDRLFTKWGERNKIFSIYLSFFQDSVQFLQGNNILKTGVCVAEVCLARTVSSRG
jgi:hypothetical protein